MAIHQTYRRWTGVEEAIVERECLLAKQDHKRLPFDDLAKRLNRTPKAVKVKWTILQTDGGKLFATFYADLDCIP